MTATDTGPAAELVLRGDWGDRRLFFEWAAGQPQAHPFVADVDGAIVGTAVGTANGAAGWVGGIFVDASQRGQGVGRALTEAVVDALESHGCRTLILVATAAGRPLYERMGFRIQTEYQTIEADGIDAAAAAAGSPLEAWRAEDLPEMQALDRWATGEDRGHILAAFSSAESASVLRRNGQVAGFVVRAPWGGGATIAPERRDAIAILEARRMAAGAGRRVRAGILASNLAALPDLEALGWHRAWQAPRLIRGEALDWHPEGIWGQFNHALG